MMKSKQSKPSSKLHALFNIAVQNLATSIVKVKDKAEKIAEGIEKKAKWTHEQINEYYKHRRYSRYSSCNIYPHSSTAEMVRRKRQLDKGMIHCNYRDRVGNATTRPHIL